MDKFREKYIALQKAFWDSDGGAASILALYEFKDELEKCDEKEAKQHKPKVVFVDENNRAVRIANYEKHGKLEDM